MIAAVVFDFDGVLVDSEPLHLRAYQEVLEPIGLSLPREKYYVPGSVLRMRLDNKHPLTWGMDEHVGPSTEPGR